MYESDFVRELKEILTNGLQAAALEVQPFGGLSGVGETWADFNWQPDGKYVNFVRCAVVVYITHTVIQESLRLPPWLEEDFVGLGSFYIPRGSPTERCIAGLKDSILASKQNRISWEA